MSENVESDYFAKNFPVQSPKVGVNHPSKMTLKNVEEPGTVGLSTHFAAVFCWGGRVGKNIMMFVKSGWGMGGMGWLPSSFWKPKRHIGF